MPAYPHLSRAPIAEALVDVRVVLPEGRTLDDLARFCDEIEADYPLSAVRRQFSGQVKFDLSSPNQLESQASQTPDGYLLRSADGIQVVQARLDGFTFSRLQPYTTWEEFSNEARRLWEMYERVAEPRLIWRLALRYVNRIPIERGADLREYFRTTFDLSEDLPQSVANFFLQIQIPFSDPSAFVIVTETIQEHENPTRLACLFDIDTFRVAAPGFDRREIWEHLQDLRDVKNRVFFGSLTERALKELK